MGVLLMNNHWHRLWLSLLGRWKPNLYGAGWEGMHEDRNSPYKGYWGELGHSLKNIPVELLRKWGIWDRGGKNERKS